MNRNEQNWRKRGATLALVITCIFLVAMIGVGIFFLCGLFGGQRELQHATDAGELNLAKMALKQPAVKLNPGMETENFAFLGDPDANGDVNLGTFNRLVAKSLIVALNAKEDPGPNNLGLTHAQQLTNALEGPGSIGERLSSALSARTNNVLFNSFNSLAGNNSVRMISGKEAQSDAKDYDTAFLEQNTNDSGATNIVVPDFFKQLLPKSMLTQIGGTTYLRGYTSPSLPSNLKIAGVPMQPQNQPHLVSDRDFTQQMQRPDALKDVFVPPNAFRLSAAVTNKIAGTESKGTACSQVGALNSAFQLSMPFGYIEVVNGPLQGPGFASVPGPFGNINNVLNHELLAPGVFISGNCFTKDLSLLDEWAAYNKAVSNGGSPAQPPLKNLYNLTGDNATPQDAATIKYDAIGDADYTHCTDTNTNGNDQFSICKPCHDQWANGSFDKAFNGRPDNDPSDPILCTPPCPCRDMSVCKCGIPKQPGCKTRGCDCVNGACAQGKSGNLMADEYCKVQLIKLFWKCGDISADAAPVTGLRTFKRGVELPWQRQGPMGVVSQMATASDLMEFVSQGSSKEILIGAGKNDHRSLHGRVRQIKPEATDQEIDALLNSRQLDLGDHCFIYMRDPLKGDRTLVFDKNPPPGFKMATPVDGKEYPKTYSQSYPLVGTFVNPHYDNGISYLMYLEGPETDDMTGTDVAKWMPCTGFNNLLGVLQFSNSATGKSTGWCKPN